MIIFWLIKLVASISTIYTISTICVLILSYITKSVGTKIHISNLFKNDAPSLSIFFSTNCVL